MKFIKLQFVLILILSRYNGTEDNDFFLFNVDIDIQLVLNKMN